MAKPVDEGRAKRFVLYYFLPAGEGQVRRSDRGPFSGPKRQVVEELLAAFPPQPPHLNNYPTVIPAGIVIFVFCKTVIV